MLSGFTSQQLMQIKHGRKGCVLISIQN